MHSVFIVGAYWAMKYRLQMAVMLLVVASLSFAQETKPLPDGEVRDLIIRGNISAFEGECPCPYTLDKNKNICGENSSYNQSPGSVKCYPGDISDQELRQFRSQNNIEPPKLPWEKDKREGY